MDLGHAQVALLLHLHLAKLPSPRGVDGHKFASDKRLPGAAFARPGIAHDTLQAVVAALEQKPAGRNARLLASGVFASSRLRLDSHLRCLVSCGGSVSCVLKDRGSCVCWVGPYSRSASQSGLEQVLPKARSNTPRTARARVVLFGCMTEASWPCLQASKTNAGPFHAQRSVHEGRGV